MARIRFGVYFDEGEVKLGRGKMRLLEAVRDEGSISAAARSMGMAYRHAWVLLDELNRCFREPVVASSTGGARGGGARLTDWGQELVDRIAEMDRLASAAVAGHLRALEARQARTARRVRPPAPRTARQRPGRKR